MLKYAVNRDNFRTQMKRVSVDKMEMMYYPSSSYKDDRNLVAVYYSNEEEYHFEAGQDIVIQNRVDINNSNGLNSTSYTFEESYPILKVNEQKGLFTFTTKRYYDLNLFSLVSSITDGNERWYFHFKENGHLFNNGDDIVIYVEYQFVDENNEAVNGLSEIKCTYETPEELSCSFIADMEELKKSIFHDNIATISGLKIYRETPFFRRTNNVFVYVDKPVCVLSIPFSNCFSTNMLQSDMISTSFVEDERNKSINRIVDMEKDVYHPVIWDSKKDGYIDGIYKEVEQITFNLHFRQHRGNNWTVEPDTYWNGCYIEDDKVKFIDEISEYSDINFFSYGKNDVDRSQQSDLLSYLGFDNSDVRYQKNKLSRSFIRLMFYDSTNPANQNLLYYSTIFVNAGQLFGKYIRYIEETPYRSTVYEIDEDTEKEVINVESSTTDMIGIKVDREPYGDLLKDEDNKPLFKDKIEEIRLSSQFIVKDKYQSEASSDGFYLYLWKDNDNGVIPTDIYMKVEFNHAGYGRTIPFMMPFKDPNKNEGNGIKTFTEILDDWNSKDGKYGARRYMKYSYIHFKYKYDKYHKQHIYYLDDEFYGENPKNGGVHYADNVMTINLYEAKMI